MPVELRLRFPDAQHVIVSLGVEDTGTSLLSFANPITDENLRDIQWYVETYAAHSLGDPDDTEARRIHKMLSVWGAKLLEAVFNKREALDRLIRFKDAEEQARLLTISAEHSDILVLPWELLHEVAPGSGFLFMEKPRISIRRRIAGAAERQPFSIPAKDKLHLLFVISRPDDAGFIDPRADSLAVLEAIDEHARGRITTEFLRPPTLDALISRLENDNEPPVDIIHFDGHGTFDHYGGLPKHVGKARARGITRLDELLRDKSAVIEDDPDFPPNTGYLLFQNVDGQCDFVSAEKLGRNLHRQKVSLVILSACESATIGKYAEEGGSAQNAPAMSSVAGRLTATGIPSVLAMTHSVLVSTTRMLFGYFYKELAQHRSVGEALDNARRYLANNPEKYEVQRGSERIKLRLFDWFVPALYQPGVDQGLLTAGSAVDPRVLTVSSVSKSNLPKVLESGFYGRKQALWNIERWFAGPTRRITLTGFGGQGKTALAQEAGRWLLRTGLFRAAVFVEYATVQSSNALGAALASIEAVLGENLIDENAATAALKITPTLVILDNLEALVPDALQELLNAAVPWSEAGGSRVLCTTRSPDFKNVAYQIEGSYVHRRIQLDGLGSKQSPDDALEWYGALTRLPPIPVVPTPKREVLVELFDRVKFHPLAIRILAHQLKTRRPAELGERLDQLLAGHLSTGVSHQTKAEDTPIGLLASLELSLDKLHITARKLLPRLGIFQGGAFEDDLIAITGLGGTDERKQIEGILGELEGGKALEMFKGIGQELTPIKLQGVVAQFRRSLAELPPPVANIWSSLRRQLEAVALIEPYDVLGKTVPFLQFHPTLAPMLLAKLEESERDHLSNAHRQRYFTLAAYLNYEDSQNSDKARAIARRELPNLLQAVHAALDAGDSEAGMFASYVIFFLRSFGLMQEAQNLCDKMQIIAGESGSDTWYLAKFTQGKQLLAEGDVKKARDLFDCIIKTLSDEPTYNRAETLGSLSKCYLILGQLDLAVQTVEASIGICNQLTQTDDVKHLHASLLQIQASIYIGQGQHNEARKAYEYAKKISEDLNDKSAQHKIHADLGVLKARGGDLDEAEKQLCTALAQYRRLIEPRNEAIALHNLGNLLLQRGKLEKAERYYRDSARIKIDIGMLSGENGIATTWNNLAMVYQKMGKLDMAENWYEKVIESKQTHHSPVSFARSLNNLATLLLMRPGRLVEARLRAEEALNVKKRLNSDAAEIWLTYDTLAEIADKDAAACDDAHQRAIFRTEASQHRRCARNAKRSFAGTKNELEKSSSIILIVVATCAGEAGARERFVECQEALLQLEPEWQAFSHVLDRIVAGERDETALCAGLQSRQAIFVETILQGL